MKKQLDLNDDQTKKISKANLEMINDKRAIQTEMQALKAKVKALRENQRIQYKNILTAEQMQKLEDMRAKRKKNKGEKGNGPKGKGHKGNGPKGK